MGSSKPLLGIIGFRKSGKTTLAEALIRAATDRGLRIGYIKHTHHPEPAPRPNDTSRALDFGAAAALLLTSRESTGRTYSNEEEAGYSSMNDFILRPDLDAILIEGFKTTASWPCIAMIRDLRELDEMSASIVAIVSTDGPPDAEVQFFTPEEVEGVCTFALTIIGR